MTTKQLKQRLHTILDSFSRWIIKKGAYTQEDACRVQTKMDKIIDQELSEYKDNQEE